MSKIQVCDVCEDEILTKFDDKAYTITEVRNAYDGFAPFKRKSKIDVCESCLFNLTANIPNIGKKTAPTSEAK